MNYSFFQDVDDIKKLLKLSDEVLCSEYLNVSKMTYYRWKDQKQIPSNNDLEFFYNAIYLKKINLNKVKEELYLSLNSENVKILMHGSKTNLNGEISVTYGQSGKDFGQGFYAGESIDQAISFVSTYPTSSLYFLKLNNFLNIKKLELDISLDWLILVAYNRGRLEKYKNSNFLKKILEKAKNADLIIAPIADNSMYAIINEFLNGTITDEQCINAVSANRLGKQYVFLNDDIISQNLEILEKCYLCTNEKKEYNSKKLMENNVGKQKVIMAKRKYAGKGKYIEELFIE